MLCQYLRRIVQAMDMPRATPKAIKLTYYLPAEAHVYDLYIRLYAERIALISTPPDHDDVIKW